LLPSLCDVVRAGVSGDHLLTATRKLLYENRFVIPGTRRLSNLMQAAVSSVEHDALSMIERSIPVLIRNRWLDALSGLADPEHRMTLLEYLQEPAAEFKRITARSRVARSSGAWTVIMARGGIEPPTRGFSVLPESSPTQPSATESLEMPGKMKGAS
jgi:hypothetical protein